MIHHRVVQGSEEWHRLRLGRPTATGFKHIITAKEWKPTKSEARRAYLIWLLTERIMDVPLSSVTTEAMQHGHDWEPKARSAYELLHGVDVELCGFCESDDGTHGCSPDGFVGDDGSIEIKCPEGPQTHMGYLLDPKTFVQEYWIQTQGQLYVTGRKWTDLVSYFSGLPMVCERVEPHPEFQAKLHEYLGLFISDLALYVDLAKTKGWIKPPVETQPHDHSKDFVTDVDVEAILEGAPMTLSDRIVLVLAGVMLAMAGAIVLAGWMQGVRV